MTLIKFVLSLAAPFLLRCVAATDDPTVSIQDGRIVGTVTSLPSATAEVYQYLGIPYASSPPERFSPPEDVVPWRKPLKAQSYKPTCIQQFSNPKLFRKREIDIYNTPPLEESEDCLYLNVFTPSTKRPSEGWPVMVWFYGGTLQIGGSQWPWYDGASFAGNQEVILVTLNYRVGLFGFSGSPEISTGQQNSGYLDQRKALEWVQRNIDHFGGNRSKVTVFGESAGAKSVLQLIATPPQPLPFRAAILQSTPIIGQNNPQSWQKLAKEANCSQVASSTECLRKRPASQINHIAEKFALSFDPVNDNVTSVYDARTTLVSGKAAKVPMLFGSNAQEGRLFSWLFGYDSPKTNIRAILNATYPGMKSLQNAILQAYSEDRNDPFRFLARYETDIVFQCPFDAFSQPIPNSRYNIYQYYYNVTFPNLRIFPQSGVYHGAEIRSIFGTYPRRGATHQQRSLSQQLQQTWADFAKHPQRGPGWPKLGSNSGKELLAVTRDSQGHIEQRLIKRSEVNEVCKIYKDVVAPL